MSYTSSDRILFQPALGQDVQLGMLYDARSSQFFAGISPWDNAFVNAKQELDEVRVQNGDFDFWYSLEDARKGSSLDLEGSLNLDLKILTATGSAKYLNDMKSSTHEARADVSCTIARRTRRIPQEVLSAVKYSKYFNDTRYTHFVAEVVEGGSATLSFAWSCSSDEEAKRITGELKAGIFKIPAIGSAKVEFTAEEKSKFENVKISYSGAIAENVSNLEDACRVAHDMPKKLAKQLNTLSYKLLPLQLLDSEAHRLTRSLDAGLVARTAAVLKAGSTADLELGDLAEREIFQQFPAIKRQISNFQAAFSIARTEFITEARQILPELRDGTMSRMYMVRTDKLCTAISLLQRRIKLAGQFIRRKDREASMLRTIVAELQQSNFENHLGKPIIPSRSFIGGGSPRLFLSLGGPSIGRAKHPLQASIESGLSGGGSYVTRYGGDDAEGEDDLDDDEEEWFQTAPKIAESCADLCRQRSLTIPGVTVAFGVASIDGAYLLGETKKTKTSAGDIVLDSQGKLLIVTGMLPKAPGPPELTVEGQTITVSLPQERQGPEELAIPTTGFTIGYRRRPDLFNDGILPPASNDKLFTKVDCSASEKSVVLDSRTGDCDYEVAIRVQTIVGASEWSTPIVVRTAKLQSVACEMIDFFNRDRDMLSKPGRAPGGEPWEMYFSSGNYNNETLLLGHTEVARCQSTHPQFINEVAVRIVDVAVEFKPEIKAASVEDVDETLVVVFAGASGHSKNIMINAFVSSLLGGEADDPARIQVIDDREAIQSSLAVNIVTCFRIRPLSSLFQGKTLLIVDTPGYYGSLGVKHEVFVTAAMLEFFKTVRHVNAIAFTCRAGEIDTTAIGSVPANFSSLFAKDMRSCLRTLYTFTDHEAPSARRVLGELGWPIEKGEIFEIFIENSTAAAENNDEGRQQSVRDQSLVMQMLLCAPPVPTANSILMLQNRILLQQKCELAGERILHTANETQCLFANLGALANVVKFKPGQHDKIEVLKNEATQEDLPEGNKTMVCLECNVTCHSICSCGENSDEIECIAMSDGRCTVCKGRCQSNKHEKASYIVTIKGHSKLKTPRNLTALWNKNNDLLEGALLGAINKYLQLQEGLRSDIFDLEKLSEELTSTAILHDLSSNSPINYIDTLIKNARLLNASPEQLMPLMTAKSALILVREVGGKGPTQSTKILLDVIKRVRKEMNWRMIFSLEYTHGCMRMAIEPESLNFYRDLWAELPIDIRDKVPKPLQHDWPSLETWDVYPKDLPELVKLVQVVLKDGGVVAALAYTASTEESSSSSEGPISEVGPPA
ncbi:hypothetical protein TWF481_001406 [Arthrobotrys musiformis]|uniref:Fibronectin type-III domain-containing protein n=1 Tax=Arthrobotrys musiformis TaxID=47236 RepID=A0AAV9WRJ6_9PEZI